MFKSVDNMYRITGLRTMTNCQTMSDAAIYTGKRRFSNMVVIGLPHIFGIESIRVKLLIQETSVRSLPNPMAKKCGVFCWKKQWRSIMAAMRICVSEHLHAKTHWVHWKFALMGLPRKLPFLRFPERWGWNWVAFLIYHILLCAGSLRKSINDETIETLLSLRSALAIESLVGSGVVARSQVPFNRHIRY